MKTPEKNSRLRLGRGRFRMAYRIVAARALQTCRLAVNHVAVDRGSDRFMTAPAGVLGNLVVELCDLDCVRITSRS